MLVKELAMVRNSKDESVQTTTAELIETHLEDLSMLGLIDHFKHATSLKEHLFKNMKDVCSTEGLGKKKFRRFVDIFLEPIFRNTQNEAQNCAIAA